MRCSLALPAIMLLGLALVAAGPVSAQEPAPGGPEVRMLDQGAEPRQLLRYRFAEGSSDTLEVDIVMAMSAAMDGVDMMTMELPMSMSTTNTVTEVYEDGSARVEFTIGEWDLSGMTALTGPSPELDEAMAMLEGMGGWMVIDDRGTVREFGMDLPADLPSDLQSQTQQFTSDIEVLPEDPVGVGARWESVMASAVPGLDMEMVATTEVASMDDDVVVLEQSFTSGMAPDLGEMLGLGLDMGESFMEMEISGSGMSEIRLDRVSQPSEMEVTIGMTMGIDDGERVTGLDYDIVMNVDASLVD